MRLLQLMQRRKSAGLRPGTLLLFAVALLLSGCHTPPLLPPADLAAPGWRVQQGQAVWKPMRSRPELAGELILATQTNGNFFVQLAKTPFSLATGQVLNDQWQIEFGNGNRRWGGRGNPPSRFVWFQLPRALASESLNPHWHFTRPAPDSWRLENSRTGESLEGGFFR
jgi:hypothetical protein